MLDLKSVSNFMVFTAIIISLILTPFINGDAMIIPKMMILFCFAAYLIPQLFVKNIFTGKNYKRINILYVTTTLIVIQMILVVIATDSPISQQIYGRGGRGMGLITFLSLMILLIVSSKFFIFQDINKMNFGLLISCTLSSIYAILQKYGIDLFEWKSRTNGIIGTIGNPNFQSAFTAMAFISGIVYLSQQKGVKRLFTPLIFGIFSLSIYFCQSTQGYIALGLSVSIFILLFCWYKNKLLFYPSVVIILSTGIIAVFGMLNKGFLAPILYKYSVKSRGEMWRTAITTIGDNPIFGIGIDSFGDYSNMYKSEMVAKGVNEWADNAHNQFLEYAVTGGVLLALLQIIIVIVTFYSFVQIQKNLKKFDAGFTALLSAWVVYQAQSLISPGTIPLLVWNFIISGAIVGISVKISNPDELTNHPKTKISNPLLYRIGALPALIAAVIIFPYFNNDRILEKSFKIGDVTSAVKSVKSIPESTTNYRLLGTQLLTQGYQDQALDVARAAVKFNPNSFTAWALLFSCEKSTAIEKQKSVKQLLRLDPTNKIVKDLSIEMKISE